VPNGDMRESVSTMRSPPSRLAASPTLECVHDHHERDGADAVGVTPRRQDLARRDQFAKTGFMRSSN
jgi:hypothetical protein